MAQRVLVVDDEPSIREILSIWLEEAGYEACTAANGMDALLQFNQKSPDLVIADVIMPQMDGYELCRLTREVSAVPFMLLTCLGLETDRTRGIRLGADDYLIKPVSMQTFLNHVSTLLHKPKVPSVMEILRPRRPHRPADSG